MEPGCSQQILVPSPQTHPVFESQCEAVTGLEL